MIKMLKIKSKKAEIEREQMLKFALIIALAFVLFVIIALMGKNMMSLIPG
jgi:hypothetical protein